MSYCSFAPTSRPTLPLPDSLKKWLPTPCDDPENGGITGRIGKNNKPNPWIMEERPSTIDFRTGERVYVDQLPKYGWLA